MGKHAHERMDRKDRQTDRLCSRKCGFKPGPASPVEWIARRVRINEEIGVRRDHRTGVNPASSSFSSSEVSPQVFHCSEVMFVLKGFTIKRFGFDGFAAAVRP